MSGRDNLEELLDVLETIRQEKYPEIPQEVIKKIVIAQFDNQDKRLEARNKTTRIVSDFINAFVETEED